MATMSWLISTNLLSATDGEHLPTYVWRPMDLEWPTLEEIESTGPTFRPIRL